MRLAVEMKHMSDSLTTLASAIIAGLVWIFNRTCDCMDGLSNLLSLVWEDLSYGSLDVLVDGTNAHRGGTTSTS